VKRLTEMGHEPQREPLRWNLKRQMESDDQARARAKELGGTFQERAPVDTTPELAANTWHNIVVDLKGTERPREVLIIGAHFDAVPGSPGADDNGSGTAALLEVARVLKGVPLKRSVRLVFFNLEEIGLRGSAEHVRARLPRMTHAASPSAADTDKELILGMVSLEMLGFFCDAPNCQKSPFPAIPGVFEPPTVGDSIILATTSRVQPFSRRLDEAMRAASPTLKTFRVDFSPVAPPDLMRSDHGPFLVAGFPALMMTDTANFRNPHYHQPSDTPETLDAARFTAVVRGLVGAIVAIANEDVPADPARP
jgi:Zn-dependent M28 family amino/carboxypeptidase